MDNKKYANNYDYHRALFMMNQEPFLENGFFILRENTSLHSPLSTLNYEFYQQISTVNKFINDHKEEVQCSVNKEVLACGQSQQPSLIDYADGVDTLFFLKEIFEN